MARRYNPRKIKIHKSYRVDEAADALGVSVQTIRNWVRDGLPVFRSKTPFLILGCELRAYIERRFVKPKHKLNPGEFTCFGCRAPRLPFGMMADYVPLNAHRGRLVGLCPVCEATCSRFVALASLTAHSAVLDISIPGAKAAEKPGEGVAESLQVSGGKRRTPQFLQAGS